MGLVFIFIIAFIINGLPSFWNKSDSGEVAVATESTEDTAVGIGVNERKAGEAIERIEPATAAANNNGVVVETQGNSDVRFVAELPKGVTNASANAELKPVAVTPDITCGRRRTDCRYSAGPDAAGKADLCCLLR